MQDHASEGAATHLLIVDDDPAMRAMLANYLTERGFKVTGVADGRAARQVIEHGSPALLLLDLKLAAEDGLDLLRTIRTQSDLPVVIMTGHRREEIDRVVGLELGADDYLAKPLRLRELVARIRAILRRSRRADQHLSRTAGRERFHFAGWQLDTGRRRLIANDGREVPLTAGDFALLLAFLKAPRQILSREQLLAASRLHEDEVFDRSIDVQILRLRRKLETNPSAPELITTERGAGYMLTAEVSEDEPVTAVTRNPAD